jgi:mitogen-activated protein kinase kinase 1 interacting protein 1
VSVYGAYQLVQFNHSSLITTFVANSSANTGKYRWLRWLCFQDDLGNQGINHVCFVYLGLLLELGSELESVTQVIATALHERQSGAL